MKIADIIKYEGDNSTFVWKHPTENFNSGTQLIVNESQEAVFYMNGQALDLFGAGRHTLETQNIPMISKFFNKATNDNTPFHCEVYFINKVDQMAIKWGTDSRIQYIDPTYGFPLSIGASGEMALRVEDSRKLLIKLVGTSKSLGRTELVNYFRAYLMTKIKSYIAMTMKTKAINIFEIDQELDLFSQEIKVNLMPDFTEYGIVLERFYVTTVSKPEGEEQYEKFKNLHFRRYTDIEEAMLQQRLGIIAQQTEAQKIVIESQAIAQKRIQEGYTYDKERGFDVAEKVASNEGVGQFSSMGVGLGIMTGVSSTVGGILDKSIDNTLGNQTVVQPVMQESTNNAFCDNCGSAITSGAAFCEECGQPVAEAKPACTNCSFVFEKPGKFCPKCGTKRGASNE